MMTPQEVSEHAFEKASFGGYNMAMVDEFLDQLTVDYTALYKENASLKAKMKVLADSLEEYRATEKGMRRALLAAQQAADEIIQEAEDRKAELLRGVEADVQSRVAQLRRQTADEEARLLAAQSATAGYVEKVRAVCRSHEEFLDSLSSVTAPDSKDDADTAADAVAKTVHDIEESVQRLLETDKPVEKEPVKEPEEAPVVSAVSAISAVSAVSSVSAVPAAPVEELAGRSRRDQERSRAFEETEKGKDDTSPTRRIDFTNLQFGANYDLK